MRALRLLLIAVAISLLGVVAAGTYIYYNLPRLVSQHAAALLADSGVTQLHIEQFAVERRTATVSGLAFVLDQPGMRLDTRLDTLRLHYDFLDLLRGRVHALEVDAATLTVQATGQPAARSTASPLLYDMLPYRLAASLPVERVDVASLTARYLEASQPPVEITGKLSSGPAVASQWNIVQGDTAVALDLNSSRTQPLQGQLQVSWGNADVGQLQFALQPMHQRRWQWQISTALQHEPLLAWLRAGPLAAALAASGAALDSVSVAGASQAEATIVHSDDIVGMLSDGVPAAQALTVQANARHDLDALSYGELLRGVTGGAASSITLEQGRYALALTQLSLRGATRAAQLGLEGEAARWLALPNSVPLQMTAATLRVAVHAAEPTTVAVSDLALSLGDARNSVQLQAPRLALTLATAETGGAPQATSLLSAQVDATVNARVRGQQVPQLQLALEQSGTVLPAAMRLQFKDAAGAVEGSLRGEGDVFSGTAQWELRLGSDNLADTAATWLPLAQALQMTDQALVVSKGGLLLHSVLRTEAFAAVDTTTTSTLSISGVDGSVGDYAFHGLEANVRWRGLTQLQTLAPARLSVARLDVALPITDIELAFEVPERAPVNSARIVINTAAAKMLGGKAYLPAGETWQVGATSNALTLKVEDWQLAQLVALQRGQDIQASGALTGDLPVVARSGRLMINAGFIAARPPGGSIRYSPTGSAGDMVAGNPELALALELLQNFSYDTLRSDVNLDETGNLALGLSIAGRNPEYAGGRAVTFNINLEQNIDPLLQSLQLSDKLIEGIERKRK